MKTLIILLSCYLLGGYATTDILRLLQGCEVKVSDNSCFCPSCHKMIPVYNQIPIISYIAHKGKCYNCGAEIPIISIALEVGIFLSFSIISYLMHFSVNVFFLLFLLYEFIKIVLIVAYKKRCNNFLREYLISILLNSLIFCVLFLLAEIANRAVFFLSFF